MMVIYDCTAQSPYNQPWTHPYFDGCFGNRNEPSLCNWVVPGTWPIRAVEFQLADQEQGMTQTVEAVADSADFGPAYDGEDYVTLTFRVPKSQAAIPGIWDLTPRCPGTREWATTKNHDKAEARERQRRSA